MSFQITVDERRRIIGKDGWKATSKNALQARLHLFKPVFVMTLGPPVLLYFQFSSRSYRIRHLAEDRLCQPEEEGEIEVLSPLRMENYWHNRNENPIGWVS